MSTRFASAGLLVLGTSLLLAGFRFLPASQATVVLQVGSANPDSSITVRGAYLFEGGTLQVIEGGTPFELAGPGPLAIGIFERQGSGPDVHLEIFRHGEENPTASVTSRRVIVGNEVVGPQVFVRGY
jgi:hypothetical protein